MLDINLMLRCLGMEGINHVDPLGASVAFMAGMKRHGLAVRPQFYLVIAEDPETGQSVSASGLAIEFNGQVFDAGGHLGWDAIEASAQARLDTTLDDLLAVEDARLAMRGRRYELQRMPACDPCYYHAILGQCNPLWVAQAEMTIGAARISS